MLTPARKPNMDADAYSRFNALRADFKKRVEDWDRAWPGLREAQQSLADSLGYEYQVETPLVYSVALDRVERSSNVRIVLVADNPGLNEQRADKRAYLVGQSGKLAEGLFRRELGIDFRTETVILNKTPLHTPKTRELAALPEAYRALLKESQLYMAGLCLDAARALGAELWITGYSELGPRGVFHPFAVELARLARESEYPASRILVFRHFSMNQFSGDLKKRRRPGETAMKALKRIGAEYRKEKLGL
jgi:hypothetical protein